MRNADACPSTIGQRTTTITYTANGQFPVTVANPKSQVDTWAFAGDFGGPTSFTDPNVLATTWEYDTFGRRTQETRPDGTYTTFDYNYCARTCPTNGSFYVQIKFFAADGTKRAPNRWTYYDALGRTIAADMDAFGGDDPVRVTTEYDTAGRVKRVSRPYFSAGSPLWNTYTYESLGRVRTLTQPADGTGANSVVTYDYKGLTTSATVPQRAGVNGGDYDASKWPWPGH